MPAGKGTYGSQVGRPSKKRKKAPAKVSWSGPGKNALKIKEKKKKRYNPYGGGSNMDPSKASRTTGP
jgi:hypothetical protein